MSDNTANMATCPQCGNIYNPAVSHTCQTNWRYSNDNPWMPSIISPGVVIDPSLIDYLRRITEALEAILNLMTPSKPPPQKIENIANIGEVILTPLNTDGEP